MTSITIFTKRMEKAFINKNIMGIKYILDLYIIDNIIIFKIAYDKNYLNYDITKFLIEYFISKNINIHIDDDYIFYVLCLLKHYDLVKWFIEYCESSNNRIDEIVFNRILYSACQFSSLHIVEYLFEYSEKHTKLEYQQIYKKRYNVIEICCRRNIKLLKYIFEYYYKNNIRLYTFGEDIIGSAILYGRTNILKYLVYLFEHKYIYLDISMIKKISIYINTLHLFDKFFNIKHTNVMSGQQYKCNYQLYWDYMCHLKHLYNNRLCSIFDIQLDSQNNRKNYIILIFYVNKKWCY